MNSKFNSHLSQKQIEIMLKFYYIKSLIRVAEDEKLTANQVRTHLSNAFSIIRLSYAPEFRKGRCFDSKTVLCNMANRANMDYEKVCEILQSYIEDGLLSENKQFWERILFGKTATPIELMDFLYARFEADITPMHTWDLFGTEL